MLGLLSIPSFAYAVLLLINSIAILSYNRFLVPLGLTTHQHQTNTGEYDYNNNNNMQMNGGGVQGGIGGGGGGAGGEASIKQRTIALIDAVRTLLRGTSTLSHAASILVNRDRD